MAKTSHVNAAAAGPVAAAGRAAGADARPARTTLSRQIEAATQRLQEANKRRKEEAKRIAVLTRQAEADRRRAMLGRLREILVCIDPRQGFDIEGLGKFLGLVANSNLTRTQIETLIENELNRAAGSSARTGAGHQPENAAAPPAAATGIDPAAVPSGPGRAAAGSSSISGSLETAEKAVAENVG